jgi:SAM-dependent methyltransferase
MTISIKTCSAINDISKSPFLNWIFKVPALGSREDAESYAEWEFQNAEQTLTCFKPYNDIRHKSILDVGCGFGGKSTYYALHGAKHVEAIDLDKERIEAARAFAGKKNANNIRFEVEDAASLPFAQEQFDLVVFTDSFEHVQNPAEVLKECFRLLRKGGTVNILFPPYGSPWGAHLFAHIRIPWAQFLISEEDLVSMWKKEFDRELDEGAVLYSERRIAAINNARTIADLTHLNKMSISKYERILKSTQFRTCLYRAHTPGNLVPCLAILPITREYIVTRVVAVLRK